MVLRGKSNQVRADILTQFQATLSPGNLKVAQSRGRVRLDNGPAVNCGTHSETRTSEGECAGPNGADVREARTLAIAATAVTEDNERIELSRVMEISTANLRKILQANNYGDAISIFNNL